MVKASYNIYMLVDKPSKLANSQCAKLYLECCFLLKDVIRIVYVAGRKIYTYIHKPCTKERHNSLLPTHIICIALYCQHPAAIICPMNSELVSSDCLLFFILFIAWEPLLTYRTTLPRSPGTCFIVPLNLNMISRNVRWCNILKPMCDPIIDGINISWDDWLDWWRYG